LQQVSGAVETATHATKAGFFPDGQQIHKLFLDEDVLLDADNHVANHAKQGITLPVFSISASSVWPCVNQWDLLCGEDTSNLPIIRIFKYSSST